MQTIVLAAGIGKRMNSPGPKVLEQINGRPIITYLLDAIRESGVSSTPVIVVGYQGEKVIQTLGNDYVYAWQAKQFGTGHAVKCAEASVSDKSADICVLYGDHPNVQAPTLRRLYSFHKSLDADMSMATVRVDDFAGWRGAFWNYGRVVRNGDRIEKIIERKDATESECEIKEVNPSYFCIKGDWLWKALGRIKNINAQGEYYLTDLVGLAVAEKMKLESITISPEEALGANTPEELACLESIMISKTEPLRERAGAV